MSKINIAPFDASEYLDSEEAISAYLNEALASGEDEVFLIALADVVKARGMTKIAKEAGVGRESLYKTLAAGSKPRFETIQKITHAMGVKLVAVPEHEPA
jgi:probable addiction module antidote protein